MEEKILLDIQLKTSDALTRIEQIKRETKSLSEQQAENTKQAKLGTISTYEADKANAKLSASLILLQQEKKALSTLTNNDIKAATALEGSYDKLSSQYNINKQLLNDMSLAQRASTDEGKKLEQETFNIYQEMIRLQEATGKHVLSVGDYTKVIQPLIDGLKKENVVLLENNKQLEQQKSTLVGFNRLTQEQTDELNGITNQIKLNTQAYNANNQIIQETTQSVGFLATKEQKMGEVTVAGSNTIAGMTARLSELQKTLQTTDVGSKQFKEANKEAQSLKLRIDQTLGKVNEFGDKEPKNLTKKAFSDTAEAGAGLVSIVQLANVALGENEVTSQLQAKTLKAVAISQLAMNAAKGVGAIMDVKDLVVKGLLIVKEKLYASAVDQTTGKLKLARVAMISTGIGALVVGLVMLIANFKEVSKFIERFTNGIKDWVAEISGGNKFLMQLADILTTIGSPLIFVIKLINDFKGTLEGLQNSVNGAMDSIASKFGVFEGAVKAGMVPFNLFINALKTLGGETKKYKIDLESVTKMHEKYNAQLDKDANKRKQQIDLAKAQGKSETDLRNLTKDNLEKTTKARQIEFDNVLRIMKAKKKTYESLSEEETKLYDEIKGALDQSIVDQKIYDADIAKQQRDAAKERYKERLELERSLQHELIVLRNGFIKDDFDKQRADLIEQQRIDKEANDLAIIDATKKFGEKSQIVSDLQEKNKLQLQKFNDDMFAIDVAQADKEIDVLNEKIKTEQQIIRESFIGQVQALSDKTAIEKDLLNASFVNTGKTLDQKKNQEIQHNNDLLAIEMKFLQDKLTLAKQFAQEDGLISDEEVQQINDLANAIAGVQEKIKQGEGAKVVDGLGLTPKDLEAIQMGADAILSILDTIKSVVDANAANQIRAIDDRFKYEEAAIQHSTLSEEEKEKKIQALNKKSANEKYKIELEQFETNKAISIVNTIITTAQAVMAALANPTPFAGPILAAIAAATGATQLGIIASQPPPPKPQFAKGVIGLNGAGHGTSDNINASLSVGESVMTAKATRVYHKQLAAMEMSVGNNPNYNPLLGKFAGGLIGDGGLSDRSITDPINSGLSMTTQISNEIGKQLKSLKIITKISDINRVGGEVVNNKVTASI
jgi:hypothetical protein